MAQPAPVAQPTLRDSEFMLPTSHTKTFSGATEGTQRLTSRLTPSLPVLLPKTHVHTDHQASFSSRHPSPADSARSSPQLAAQPVFPTDPTNFLTTLAAQERRVLELREELQKAESDLVSLKKQWAIFEANRKNSGIRHVEQLQPLSASHLSKTDSGGNVPTPLNVSTFEKLAAKPPRKPQQRVFSGSRHTRTLSLLTPAPSDSNKSYHEAFPNVTTAAENSRGSWMKDPLLSRSSTLPSSEANAGFGKTYKNIANRRSMPPPSTDALVKTGKQMASDLRDGLWTFFEDIRQATVGEEGISGSDTRNHTTRTQQKSSSKSSFADSAPRRKRSTSTLENSSRHQSEKDLKAPRDHGRTDTGPEQSFWKEFGVDTPGRNRLPSLKPSPERRDLESTPHQQREELLVNFDDDWIAWESPISLQKTSPRRNVGGGSIDLKTNNDSADVLPWPALNKMTPSKLTRTVSDLMRDWDSPYPGQYPGPADLGEQVLASPHM